METKFTPWRMEYIKRDDHTDGACVFCTMVQAPPANDGDNLLLYRGAHCFVVLNLYPYNPAHLMVVPNQHRRDLANLEPAVGDELFTLTRRSVAIIEQAYRPHGFNLGMNLGRMAGAGIAEHLHMHVVPRWGGDTNFMPVVGQTKLIPEELAHTYMRLRAYFSEIPTHPG